MFFAVIIALLPLGLGVADILTRGDTVRFTGLFEHGELFLVSMAVLGAGLSDLLTPDIRRFPTVRFWVGCAAGMVLVVAAGWFADVAANLRDGSKVDHHAVAVSSLVVFSLALASSLSCVIVAVRSETTS
jgi:hypothetical protein